MSAEVVHRVGMAVAVMAVVLCAVALVREARRGRAVRKRVSEMWGAGPGRYGEPGTPHKQFARLRLRSRTSSMEDGTPRNGLLKEWAGPLGAAAFMVILIGGVTGVLAGLAVGYGAHRRLARQRDTDAARSADAEVRAELAPAGDLLAACLAAGAGPRESAEAVGRSLDGPVAERLRQVAAELRLGGEPAVVWPRLAALPGAEGLARCMERAGISGVPAVESASRVAAELRAEQARAATARARRAGVLVTLPLSACFLPAFLALGVVPVLIGLAGGLLGRN
ncbi:Type II secretion system (T2SS), protein F [Streptomyces sp. 2112.3]|uniref:type II secretion system F family protein n=1 Tax=Streptomyces sp. 2112.3 TaxID=1881023 RepID=UPI00089946D4|nr:Type II secretion system (T2SS), protein F [Streptomyces sp. 2112.3]